jgi:hypothetical protein
MTICGDPDPDNSNSSSDDDVEDGTYMHLPGLVLIEKGWQVLVAVGQRGMRK